MDIFKHYRIEKNDDGIILVLYLNENSVEFADDIIDVEKNISKLNENTYEYIKNKFPKLQIKAVKFVIGGVILATIPFSALTVKAATSSLVASNNNMISYRVKSGDSLWKLSKTYKISIDELKKINSLKDDDIIIDQVLLIPKNISSSINNKVINKINVPIAQKTYKVKKGDTALKIAKKFNIPVVDILKFNYMERNEWLDEGEVIVLNTFAARSNTVTKGQDSKPLRKGKLVDWFLEAQYIIKRGDVFTIVDVDTGKQFKGKMMGGYNHADIEPLTKNDTKIMKGLFGKWTWTPRAVVVYKDGINFATSLSGEPHGEDIIKDNNVKGHFDLYFSNSKPHNIKTSKSYIAKHYNMIIKASKK